VIRRLITVAMLVAYAAGQWAAMPHAHASAAGKTHSGPKSQPHVHFSLFAHSDHDHAHDGDQHSHDSHSHRGHHHEHSTDESPSEHDSDAVYLPANLDAASVAPKYVTLADDLPLVGFVLIASNIEPAPLAIGEISGEIGQECTVGCPRYLALRALRI
jgi:uncharacterized protein involved in copper resistance